MILPTAGSMGAAQPVTLVAAVLLACEAESPCLQACAPSKRACALRAEATAPGPSLASVGWQVSFLFFLVCKGSLHIP